MKRCFIVDSAIGLNALPEDCYSLPMQIIIEDEAYIDTKDFDNNILYTAIREKKKIGTSQPILGQTEELLIKLKEQYDEFVFIHTAPEVSGTIKSSEMLGRQLELNHIVINSFGTGPHIKHVLNYALELSPTSSLSEMEEKLAEYGKGAKALLMPGSLERLKLSGRISNSKYLLSEILKISPIFLLDNGVCTVFDKKRTHKKAVKALIEHFENLKPANKSTTILHISATEFVEEMKERYPEAEVFELHACIAAHFGEGTIGFLWNE